MSEKPKFHSKMIKDGRWTVAVTPVIAYRSGSVPEVVGDGVTGFIVESEEEAIDAVKQLA